MRRKRWRRGRSIGAGAGVLVAYVLVASRRSTLVACRNCVAAEVVGVAAAEVVRVLVLVRIED
jgi:hypothetical protein